MTFPTSHQMRGPVWCSSVSGKTNQRSGLLILDTPAWRAHPMFSTWPTRLPDSFQETPSRINHNFSYSREVLSLPYLTVLSKCSPTSAYTLWGCLLLNQVLSERNLVTSWKINSSWDLSLLSLCSLEPRTFGCWTGKLHGWDYTFMGRLEETTSAAQQAFPSVCGLLRGWPIHYHPPDCVASYGRQSMARAEGYGP